MNDRAEELQQMLDKLAIDPDAYQAWKSNIVTNKFMLDIELQLIKVISDLSPSLNGSIEKIAIATLRNSVRANVLEEILEWKPEEIKTRYQY